MAGTVSPNLPIVIAATLLLLRHFPAVRAGMRRDAGGAKRSRIVLQRQLYVSARFAVACTVFFAAFFALPLWLFQSAILGAVGTGAAMAPVVIVSALTTPDGGPNRLTVGGRRDVIGLCLGTGLLVTANAQTSVVVILAAMVALGASHAFNNLGL